MGPGLALTVVLAATACSRQAPTLAVLQHRQAWREHAPRSYAFTFSAGGMAGDRSARLKVTDGRVVSFTQLDGDPFRFTGAHTPLTVDGVFDLALADMKHADKVTVVYDEDWEFPASVSVDELTRAIDDEHGYSIRQFVVLAGDRPTPSLELASAEATCRVPPGGKEVTRRVLFMRIEGSGQAELRVTDARGRDLIDPVTVSHGDVEPYLRPAPGTTSLPRVGRVRLTSGHTLLVDEKRALTPGNAHC